MFDIMSICGCVNLNQIEKMYQFHLTLSALQIKTVNHANSVDPNEPWALEAQPDERLTGDQEVVGLIPAGSGITILRRLIIKYFLQSFFPFCWFKKDSC